MRRVLLIVIVLMLLAACQNNTDNGDITSDSGVDETTSEVVDTSAAAPRTEATPEPSPTPLPTPWTIATRTNVGHVFAVSTRTIHFVQRGETMFTIASQYGVSVKDLADANRIYNYDLVKAGDTLLIPPCE